MSKRSEILSKLDSITDLPTLPDVMIKLNKVLEDVNCGVMDIVKILESDPAISVQILKTVNSPLFATCGAKITSLQNAISRLGFREVKNIALSTSVYEMMNGVKSNNFDRKEFWRYCMATSLGAAEIAVLKKDPRNFRVDELHLAGLVHGMGKMILDSYFPEYFQECLALAKEKDLPLYDVEREHLGIDHCELGAIVSGKWKLPLTAVNAIKYNANPQEAPDNVKPAIMAVHLASFIANSEKLGNSGEACPIICKGTLKALDMDIPDFESVKEQVLAKEAEMSDSLG